MSLSQEQLSKYGLSIVDGGSESDGVFNSNGTYYKINNFQRGKSEGLDQDKGAVFNSSLEKDAGLNVTTFNTINDVKGAVNKLTSGSTSTDNEDPVQVVHSERLAGATERLAQAEADRIDGTAVSKLYNRSGSNNAAQSFMNNYVNDLGNKLASGFYINTNKSPTNSSRVASGQNDVSIDVSKFAKTGLDNRKNY